MALSVRDLTFGYHGAPVLKNLATGDLARGSLTALVGPNGSGKSTLFRCIAGLLAAKQAVMTLDGAALGGLASRERSRRIFYMAQDTGARAALSVFEVILLARKSMANVMSLGASGEDTQRVERVVAELGLTDLASRDISTLSGGQRQLTGIGQALVRDPCVLLLDEPTSALDVRRQLEVMDTIRRITRQRKIVTIVAIHDLSLAARFADHILLLNGGRIARSGAPAEVLADRAVAETYAVGIHLEQSARGTLLVEPYLSQSALIL
jgi:iron complex transport system ATP-binding protein